MRRRSIALLLVCASGLVGMAPPKVTEPRALVSYEGRWEGVQFGGLIFELRNSRLSLVSADSPEFQREFQSAMGKTQIRNIAPTSTRFDWGPYGGPVQQAFYAECAVLSQSERLSPTDEYVPCGLLLEDGVGIDGSVKRRFIVRNLHQVDIRFANRTVSGFFDPAR